MAFPASTPSIATILAQEPAPIEDQDYKRHVLANAAYGKPVTTVISTALEASKVLKSSAGKLHTIAIFNSKASAQFILIMDSATVPADGAVTLLYPPIPIAAATLVQLDLSSIVEATNGIAICNSSTGTFTKTVGSADCVFLAQVS